MEPDEEATPPQLPPRPPRSFLVHWGVDAAIAFLVVLFPLLLLGATLWPYAIAAAVIGLAVAPTTQRKEAEALERRKHRDDL